MNSRQRRVTRAIALLLAFSTAQVYVGVSFAGRQPGTMLSEGSWVVPQQPTGVLSTQGNKPITLNGAPAIGGATLLSGATIETPRGVDSAVNLGALGWLRIEANSKLTLEFQNGSVRVMLFRGCVTLHTRKGTSGEVDTPQGVLGKSEADRDGVIRTCTPGAVAALPPAATAGGGGLLGLGTAGTIAVAVLAGTFVAAPIATRGRNPSPSVP